uniref:Ubiquitin-like protease family profile domain-containing protein n=1 Tax=Chenopodium quinoa TaxID=63459 RepID=A0A803MSF2_CHEQI
MPPWLCQHFNEKSCVLKIDMLKEFFNEWKKKLGIAESDDIFVNNLENKIKSLKEGGDDFKRFFVMYICITFLAPVAYRVIDYKIISYADNVKEIRNLDWCGYVLNNLCKAMGSFKKNKHKESRSGISGCLLILQIVCTFITFHLEGSLNQQHCRRSNIGQMRKKGGKQSYLGDVIETAYRNLANRERRLVSFNVPDGVMTDSEIHEAAHDIPLEISLASQKTSQEAKDRSLKSVLIELSQAWLYWLQLCNAKHQFMEVDLVGEMSELMNKLEHPKAEDIMSYEFDNSNINSNRDAIVDKVSKFKVSKKFDVDAEFSVLKKMIYVSDFLKENKDCVENMSLQFNQVINFVAINDYNLVFIPLKKEDHYFVVVINFRNETIDQLDSTEYEDTEE